MTCTVLLCWIPEYSSSSSFFSQIFKMSCSSSSGTDSVHTIVLCIFVSNSKFTFCIVFPHNLRKCYSQDRHQRKQSGHYSVHHAPAAVPGTWCLEEGSSMDLARPQQISAQHPTQVNLIPRWVVKKQECYSKHHRYILVERYWIDARFL